MTDEEIQKIRETYNDTLLSIKKEKATIESRIEVLKQIPEVREYISLTEKLQEIEQSRYEDMALQDVRIIASNTKHSNKIYVDIGDFVDATKINSSNSSIRKYVDLETLKIISIPKEDIWDFSENNNILHLFDIFPRLRKKTPEVRANACIQLRKLFIKELLTNPQEETVDKFLNDKGYVKKLVRDYREANS